MLHGRHVVYALGEAAGQLLKPCEAVEFQRIEIGLTRLDVRVSRLDLRFGLDLDLAHLRAQANDTVRELEKVALERTQLAFDAGARNGDLACFVDEAVDQVRAHPQHRRPRRLGFRRRSGNRLSQRRRCFHRLGCDDGKRRRCSRRRRCRFLEPRQRRVHLAFLQAVEHEGQPVEIGIEGLEQFRSRFGECIACEQTALHLVREFAQAHRACHPRAALERVQAAPQCLRSFYVGRTVPPCAKLLASLREKLCRFFEKDRQHLFIDIVVNVGERHFTRLHDWRHRSCHCFPGLGSLLDLGRRDRRSRLRSCRAPSHRLRSGSDRNDLRFGRERRGHRRRGRCRRLLRLVFCGSASGDALAVVGRGLRRRLVPQRLELGDDLGRFRLVGAIERRARAHTRGQRVQSRDRTREHRLRGIR